MCSVRALCFCKSIEALLTFCWLEQWPKVWYVGSWDIVMQSCLGCMNGVPGREARNFGDMENHAQLRVTVGTSEQTTMSGASFLTALEECLPSRHDVPLRDRGDAGSSVAQKSEYFSARVEEMMRSRSKFFADVEHQIEHSKVH